MNTLEKLQEHLRSRTTFGNSPPVECQSGLTMSVQASENHYCSPKNNEGPWHRVEVAFPSRRVMALREYRQRTRKREPMTQTVYTFVPTEVVLEVIEKNGGFAC